MPDSTKKCLKVRTRKKRTYKKSVGFTSQTNETVGNNESFYSRFQIIKSCKKEIPYRIVKGNVDYTPLPLGDKRFAEIKGPVDMADFVSLFLRDNYFPLSVPLFQTEDHSSLINGFLTGSKYASSTFPLRTILNFDLKIIKKKRKIVQHDFGIERQPLVSDQIEETFKILLNETETIQLFSNETSIIEKEIECEEETGEEEEIEAEEIVQPEGVELPEEQRDEGIQEIDEKVLKRKGSIKQEELREKTREVGIIKSISINKEVAVNTKEIELKHRSIVVTPSIIYFSSNEIELEKEIKSIKFEDPRLNKADFQNISSSVLDSQTFNYVFHTMEKILECNNIRKEQTIVRFPHLNDDVPKNHSITFIFDFILPKKLERNEVCEVTSLSWHPNNRCLIGVGYGKNHLEKDAKGMFCIWNVKNPRFPERRYQFKQPVTSFAFSDLYPYAVAITFYTGHAILINILSKKLVIICDTFKFASDYFPVTYISWFKGEYGDCFLVTSTKSGDMYRYQTGTEFIPELFLDLPRKYGPTKGIEQCWQYFRGNEDVKPLKIGISTFTQHPTQPGTFLVGTDDGYIHICLTVFKMKDTDVFAAHEGPVSNIEFHPVTDKLFLTSGNDYYVRIWAYLIYTPLMNFSARKEYVRYAKWYIYNSFLIFAMSENYFDVWDIRRINSSIPASTYENSDHTNNLTFNISPYDPNIIIGDAKGNVTLFIFNEIKYETKIKKELLARVLRNHIKCRDPILWKQVEEIIPEFIVTNIEEFDILDYIDDE